ncbi:MAG: transcription termination/antitermination protein NusA [Chloroflexi bacterium]|nr:transcription termination/antitermination protein NusA [Chloroflexota bacterium]
MKSEFLLAFNQICSDRGLPRDVVLDALQMALVSAYRRNADVSVNQNVTAKVSLETGKALIFVEKLVAEDVTDDELEITVANARAIRPDAQVGEVVLIESTPKNFGRIAAQSAKQIILQRIREAEREARYAHYVQQEGEIVHGTVQSIKPQAVTLHLEGTEAVLPRSQQVPGERYSLHQRLRAYVLEVRKTGRGPQIVVSRSHSNMLRRLLELEVPEIFNGAVEIRSISREAGSRSKVAVAARQLGVDPVGACVGMRGVRIQSIVNELGGEKIDVIEWNPSASTFIAKALSPAKVLSVQLEEDPIDGKTANVVVPDDQLSLAIGRAGQNARLAAKLTSWRIDIQGVTEAATWALQQVNEDPDVLPGMGLVAESLPTVANILRQHEQEKMPYHSEELLAMRHVIEGVRIYYTSIRDAKRARLMAEEAARQAVIESAKAERRAVIDAAVSLISPRAYEIPLNEMGLSARVLAHLERAELKNAGEVMERLAEGDEGLLMLDGVGPKSLTEVKQSIETLALTVEEPAPVEEQVVTEPVVETDIEAEAVLSVTPTLDEEPQAVAVVEETSTDVVEKVVAPEIVKEAPVEEEIEEVEVVAAVAAEKAPPVKAEILEPLFGDEERGEVNLEEERKRERRLRRQLIFDEESGEVVAHRRRKRGDDEFGGDTDEWNEFLG